MSIWDDYVEPSRVAAPTAINQAYTGAPMQQALGTVPGPAVMNTGVAAPTAAGASPTYDPNNPLAYYMATQPGTGYSYVPAGVTAGHYDGSADTGNWIPDSPSAAYMMSGNGTRINLGADNTFQDTFDRPGGNSKEKNTVTYKYDPATGKVVPVSANENYQASEWVTNGQPVAQLAAAMIAAYAGGAGLESLGGGAGAGGGMITADGVTGTGIGGGSAATGNMALIDSGLGTAGYGASSAGTIGAGTLGGGAATAGGLASAAGGGGAVAGGAGAGSLIPGISNGQLATGAVGALSGGGGSGGGGSGTGSGSGGGTSLGDFLGSLAGGAGTNNLLTSLLTGYAAQQSGKRAQDAYDAQLAQINGLYAPDSPYAKQMQQAMDRKDAAAGRNSQYGTRAVELASNLTKSKADSLNSANMTNLITQSLAGQNQLPASLLGLLGANGGVGGVAGAVGSGANSIGSFLNNLFKNSGSSGGSGPTVSNTTPGYNGLPDYAITPPSNPDYSNEDNNAPPPTYNEDDFNSWLDDLFNGAPGG